jgi:hypothetical protein
LFNMASRKGYRDEFTNDYYGMWTWTRLLTSSSDGRTHVTSMQNFSKSKTTLLQLKQRGFSAFNLNFPFSSILSPSTVITQLNIFCDHASKPTAPLKEHLRKIKKIKKNKEFTVECSYTCHVPLKDMSKRSVIESCHCPAGNNGCSHLKKRNVPFQLLFAPNPCRAVRAKKRYY